MRGPLKFQDPLQQLFEHHLLTRSYDDAGAFTKEVAREYLGYIDSTLAHVPIHMRANLVEDLEAEAHEMLVKKMYGVGNEPESFTNFGKVVRVEGTRKQLRTFDFYLPPTPEPTSNDSNNQE